MSTLKHFIILISTTFLTASCDVVYFKNANPSNAPTATLEADMMGDYFFNSEDYINLTKSEVDIYMTGDAHLRYTGKYGVNTKYPIYKIGKYYMLSVDPEDDDYNYYRIFLFDYNKTLGQINVRELFSGVETSEKESLIEKMPKGEVLEKGDTGGGKYLVNPKAKDFLKWVDNGSFSTVKTLQKKKFKCQKVSLEVQYAVPGEEYWADLDINKIKKDKTDPLNDFISYYEKEKIAGRYEFSIKGEDGIPEWYRITVLCAE